MPTNPSVRPSSRLSQPCSRDAPSIVVTITKASTISAKYSADPNASASFTISGAVTLSASVASVPATNDPIAAVASAAPARPLRAIWWPSIAVTIVALSPGVLSRIDVVDPPYIAP